MDAYVPNCGPARFNEIPYDKAYLCARLAIDRLALHAKDHPRVGHGFAFVAYRLNAETL